MHILSTQPNEWQVEMLKLRLRHTQPMSQWMADQPRVSTWNSIREKKLKTPYGKYHFFTILLKILNFKSNNVITRNNIYINLQDFVWILKIKSKMWDFSETWLVYRPTLGHLVPFNYIATINFFCWFCMISSQPTVVVSVYIILSSYLT